MGKMTQQEKSDFDMLYQYVKKEILEYDDSQKLPKYMVLRLLGMKQGKFIANNNVEQEANYEFSHILNAFKINKMNIMKIIAKTNFKNEQHKFNTIMLIIEKDLNDVVNRLKQIKKNNKKIESMELNNVFNDGAEYINRNKEKKIHEDLEELW